ncbi:MAG: hypothetical protein ABL958_00750 [Bdellovibrionia bacterium]
MKSSLLALAAIVGLFASAPASADLKREIDCRVATILDSNFFEESLSRGEYPTVYIEKDQTGRLVEASVGANINYEIQEGATIRRLPKTAHNDRLRYILKYKERTDYVLISVGQSGPRLGWNWGNLSVKEGNKAIRELAILLCKAQP